MGSSPCRWALRWLAPAVLISATAGCTSATEGCYAIALASIQVDVVDAATGAPAAAGSTVVLQSSTWRDSVAAPAFPDSSLTAYVWYEDRAGPGDYTVTVYKPGYQRWTETHVRVGSSHCGVSGLSRVTAMLRAIGGADRKYVALFINPS